MVAASEVRYARALVPDAFSGMLNVSPDGWQLNRLPASDDPMLARITRVRNQEYLFCDAIDEQYEELAERVIPTYALWRRATVEQAAWLERYEQRVMDRDDKDTTVGSLECRRNMRPIDRIAFKSKPCTSWQKRLKMRLSPQHYAP